MDEDNEDRECDDWIDKLCSFRDAPFSTYFFLLHWEKPIDLFGLLPSGSWGDSLDTCSYFWTLYSFNVFEFVCWVKLGDKISSPVSFRRAEEKFWTKLRGKDIDEAKEQFTNVREIGWGWLVKDVFDLFLRGEAKEWLMEEREVGWGGFVKDVFDLFLLRSKWSVLLNADEKGLRKANDCNRR